MNVQFKMKINVKMESVKKCVKLQAEIVSLVTEHSLGKEWRYESKIIQLREVHLGNLISPSSQIQLPDRETIKRAAEILGDEVPKHNIGCTKDG